MKNYKLGVTLQAIDKLTKPFKKMSKVVDGFRAPLTRLKKHVSTIGGKFSGLTSKLGLSLGGAYAALSGLVLKTTSAGDDLAKTADKLGISTDQLQKWRYAAERAGIAQNTHDMALQRFLRRLGEAKAGQGELIKGLQAMRISLRNSDGSFKTSEELFYEYMEGLDQTEDSTQRLALAMKAFDSEGVKMVNMAKGGKKAIQGLGKELEDMGGIIDEDVLRNSEKFQDEMTKTKIVVQATAFGIVGEFLPSIMKSVKGLGTWIGTNKELISSKLGTWIKNTRAFAGGLFTEISNIVGMTYRWGTTIMGWISPAKQGTDQTQKFTSAGSTLAKIVALILGFKVAAFFVGLIPPILGATSAAWGFTAALLANPITWVIAGIVTLIYWIGKWTGAWDSVGEAVGKVWDWIKELVGWAGEKLGSLIGWFGDLLGLTGEADMAMSPSSGPKMGGRQGLAAAARQNNFAGKLVVDFQNAPSGMRIAGVEQGGTADMGIETGIATAPV